MIPFRKLVPNLYWFAAHSAISIWNWSKLLHPNLKANVYAGEISIEEDMDNNLKLFLSPSELSDMTLVRSLKKDMTRCYYLHGINANEYFVHDFRHKDKCTRKTYISKRDKNYACRIVEGGLSTFNALNRKDEFYKLSSRYFQRDVCIIKSDKDREHFKEFCSRHNKCIAKPNTSSWGNGVHIISDIKNDVDDVFDSLLKRGNWMIEELVVNDERMGAFNSSSVNTVRICSFRQKDGSFVQIYPFIRTGRKGRVVDNAGGGGIYASIDSLSGVLCTNGFDENGNEYDRHPDSDIRFLNWPIPAWDDLVKLSERVHASLPQGHIYVGFDFALDKEKGWVLIEGNWGDFIAQQSSLGKGLREDVLNAIRGCYKKSTK